MEEKLLAICQGHFKQFPEGNNPFQIMTRIAEEVGELAEQVNRFELVGLKREKLGEPSKEDLAKEIKDVLTSTLEIAVHYGVEQEVLQAIDHTHNVLKEAGFIVRT